MEELNRCFVGIRLPQEAQAKLAEVQLAIRHKAGSDVVRWSNTAELQIIVLPLGELLVERVHQVMSLLPNIAAQFRPFEITLEGLGGSPSALQPRFPWVGVGGDAQVLMNLHLALERSLMPLLPNYQAKGFQGHIDLGRIKIESEQNRTALGRAIKMSPTGCIYRMAVTQFDLFRSATSSGGVHLVTEGSYPFPSF
ncbi:MAG TPA: RNA 2',3'-cyclic phosphodiesterase [Fimbriimonadaceae bacterium]|jgi:2'-5' RNA ligase